MKKILPNIILALASAFVFSSCGDSKEAVVDDAISFMEGSVEVIKSGDKEAIDKLKEESKAIEQRAKAVGIDLKDPSTLPDDLKKKFEEATKEMMKATMEEMMQKAPEMPEEAKDIMKKAAESLEGK